MPLTGWGELLQLSVPFRCYASALVRELEPLQPTLARADHDRKGRPEWDKLGEAERQLRLNHTDRETQ